MKTFEDNNNEPIDILEDTNELSMGKNDAVDGGNGINDGTNSGKTSEEVKKENFKRVALRRMEQAVKALQLVGNLSNRSTYSYEEKHVDKMISALETELQNVKEKFVIVKKEKISTFTFDDPE